MFQRVAFKLNFSTRHNLAACRVRPHLILYERTISVPLHTHAPSQSPTTARRAALHAGLVVQRSEHTNTQQANSEGNPEGPDPGKSGRNDKTVASPWWGSGWSTRGGGSGWSTRAENPEGTPRTPPRVPLGVPPRGSLGLHGNGVVPGFPARVPHGVLRARRGGRGFLLGFLAGF